MSVKVQPPNAPAGQLVAKSGTCGLSIQNRTYWGAFGLAWLIVRSDLPARRDVDRASLFRDALVEAPRGWFAGQQAGSVRYRSEDLSPLVDGVVVLTVSRFTAVKRLPLLVEAFARARDRARTPSGLVIVGGLVAGLKAGLIYDTWPFIDGAFIPPREHLLFLHPAWLNLIDNHLTVQFNHRMAAYLLAVRRVGDATLTRGIYP